MSTKNLAQICITDSELIGEKRCNNSGYVNLSIVVMLISGERVLWHPVKVLAEFYKPILATKQIHANYDT